VGDNSKIEWTDATWNPWQGCTKVSPGCDHCYAEAMWKRLGRDFSKVVRSAPGTFNLPLRLQDKVSRGEMTGPIYVFTCSVSDFFHEAVPTAWREEAWAIMQRTPGITYQVLTKRPKRAYQWWIGSNVLGWDAHPWPPNVWLGTSVESQDQAKRLDWLAQVPAPVLFASCEPLLGPLDIGRWVTHPTLFHLDWIIVGGESGPHARPMHPDWARSLRDQCQEAGVPYFFKQWGEFHPVENAGSQVYPFRVVTVGDQDMGRVGRQKAGRELDGHTWDEMPEREAPHGN